DHRLAADCIRGDGKENIITLEVFLLAIKNVLEVTVLVDWFMLQRKSYCIFLMNGFHAVVLLAAAPAVHVTQPGLLLVTQLNPSHIFVLLSSGNIRRVCTLQDESEHKVSVADARIANELCASLQDMKWFDHRLAADCIRGDGKENIITLEVFLLAVKNVLEVTVLVDWFMLQRKSYCIFLMNGFHAVVLLAAAPAVHVTQALGTSNFFNEKSSYTEVVTLNGHVESVVKYKGLDIDTIQQHYIV
nr:hypothetical protein [Tanacetum cinerariifolium]